MKVFRRLMRGLVQAALLAGFTLQPVAAETIAVIGTGNVGGTLGPAFAALGHKIVYGSRDPSSAEVVAVIKRTGNGASAKLPAEAVVGADVVVLAVPGSAAEGIARGLGNLSGKIILDPTNRVARGDNYPIHDLPGKGSNAELIQAVAPGARVVKAFNTLGWEAWVNPGATGGIVSVPIAGDDAQAKAFVASLVTGMGLQPVDVGPLAYAHILEEMLVLWGNARDKGAPFNYYLRPDPAARAARPASPAR